NEELAHVYGDERVQQSIEVAVDLTTTLWHAPGVHRLRFPGPTVRRYDDDVFVVSQILRAETQYSIESRVDLRDGRYVLREARPAGLERYLDVGAVSEQVRSLARSLTQSATDGWS